MSRLRIILATTVALAAAAQAEAKSPPDAIRVGGLSEPNEPRVAIVGSAEKLAGKRFKVVGTGGKTVARGKLRKAKGSPSPWEHAALANVSRPSAPGTYRLKVGKLTSPPWQVADSAAPALIHRLRSIFLVNADGDEPNPVYAPAHMNDAHATIRNGPTAGQTIDVEGGWRDAGDSIKFTVTTGMSSVALEYASLMSPANAATLAPISDIGIRYLVKAHPAGSQTFIAQVSDEEEHKVGFHDFASDDSSPNPALSDRPAYGEAGSGTLGAGAAALAMAARRYGVASPTGESLLTLALEWYERGKAVSGPGPELGGFKQPGGDSFDDWQGFMALAATALHRATGEAQYASEAAAYLPAAKIESGFSPYFTVGGLAAADLCGGLADPAAADPQVRQIACDALAAAAEVGRFRAALNAFGSPGGFYFGWVQSHTGNAALAAAAERAGVFAGGRALAAGAADYLQGRNPWGASFIIGKGAREAGDPHHSVFVKGEPRVLADGFVVGGPAEEVAMTAFGIKPKRRGPFAKLNPTYRDAFYDGEIVYEDRRENFVTSEVGLAYSASAILLFAVLAG